MNVVQPDPSSVTVDRGRPDDAEALTGLHLDVWDDTYTGLIPQQILDDRRSQRDEMLQQWRDRLASGNPPYVARGPEGPIGFARSGPARDPEVGIDLELWSLYVAARWWGRGIGHRLLAESLGDHPAYVWVLQANDRAITFYARQGFRLDGARAEQYDGTDVRMVRP